MVSKNPSPLDVQYWGAQHNDHLCEFTPEGELKADWKKLRECYDTYIAHPNGALWAACGGDGARFGRIIIGAALWKARNSM